MPRVNVDHHPPKRRRIESKLDLVYIDAFNSTETLSRLTQSRRFICDPLQRYPDNVRYSEETRLRSVSKSFLAAAYPRFESPDTSKDPKRGARAPCISGTDITAVSPHPSVTPGFLRLCSTPRVCQLASPRVELHSRVHHSVYIPKAEYIHPLRA